MPEDILAHPIGIDYGRSLKDVQHDDKYQFHAVVNQLNALGPARAVDMTADMVRKARHPIALTMFNPKLYPKFMPCQPLPPGLIIAGFEWGEPLPRLLSEGVWGALGGVEVFTWAHPLMALVVGFIQE